MRDTLTMELFQDPSKRVAVQLMLLITNIARFDVPSPWDALLPTLGAGAAPSSGMPPPLRQRALKALKFVLGALQGDDRAACHLPVGPRLAVIGGC